MNHDERKGYKSTTAKQAIHIYINIQEIPLHNCSITCNIILRSMHSCNVHETQINYNLGSKLHWNFSLRRRLRKKQLRPSKKLKLLQNTLKILVRYNNSKMHPQNLLILSKYFRFISESHSEIKSIEFIQGSYMIKLYSRLMKGALLSLPGNKRNFSHEN